MSRRSTHSFPPSATHLLPDCLRLSPGLSLPLLLLLLLRVSQQSCGGSRLHPFIRSVCILACFAALHPLRQPASSPLALADMSPLLVAYSRSGKRQQSPLDVTTTASSAATA